MYQEIEILKGIHPGFVLAQKLKERKIRKGKLALRIMEYPQTITSITKGRRGMNTSLALKLEKELELGEGFFMLLQAFYDIREEKNKSALKPDISKFRPVLFWDTLLERVNWEKQYKAIIKRIIERGNEAEKAEITRFYGIDTVKKVLGDSKL